MKTWFTADTHFGHANIIEYCERPFKTLDRMDEVLIKNWNSRIKKNDLVIFLGDFCFRNTPGGKKGEGSLNRAEHYLDQLNGNITFVRGNHDRNNSLNTQVVSLTMRLSGYDINCVHDPSDVSMSFPINLVGHIHQHWKMRRIETTLAVNVGVDVWKYLPVHINEITKAIEEFKKTEAA